MPLGAWGRCAPSPLFCEDDMGSQYVVIRPTITTSASPDYADGDVISGIVTLSGVFQLANRSAILRSVMLKDAAGQAPALSLLFFRATPSGGTYTDNSAIVFGSGDVGNCIGTVKVATT